MKDRVEVWKVNEGWNHPYPWRFRVHFRGKTIEFAGIPNQCETKREAAIRGWWRLRWMKEGKFEEKYQ